LLPLLQSLSYDLVTIAGIARNRSGIATESQRNRRDRT
jgi:hypothetical protein